MILTLVSTTLLIITIPGTCELLFLTLGALLQKKRNFPQEATTASIAVIIPAYNEELHIRKTIHSLKQCSEKFDIIVIADNCTDTTSQIAFSEDVRVIERNDSNQQGKNYALDFAFKILLNEKYEIFVIVDADTTVKRNFINTIQSTISPTIPIIQTRYDILNPKNQLSTLGMFAFNYIRPRGRAFWNLSCGLLGNGFAIHKKVLTKIPYTVNSIVEDLSYHITLVENGYKVLFVEDTGVQSMSPENKEGELIQRQRWEGGRLKELFRSGPKLANQLFNGNFSLIEPLLDLLLLPLSYQVCLLLLLLIIPVSFTQYYAMGSFLIISFHFFVAILLSDEKMKNLVSLLSAPVYILRKVKILPKILWSAVKNNSWIRTSRDVK
jgi:cellulose synthase/poly-beta-1,6-N-acetylglucosamine synthase-like glycosyltransferase